MWVIRIILLLLVLAVVIGFSVYNSGPEIKTVNLVWYQYYDVPMVVIVYWAMLAGMVAATFLGVTYVFRLHADLRAERRARKRLEAEMASYRNRTIEELDGI
jgi:uncharacterized integral membrane protein